jgi:prepilin-type N-terminal cleavage/methylation domain-containing protein
MKKGFSLIELVIVIAIMSIMVGLTSLGLSFLKSKDTKTVAYGIESSLTKLKSSNMAGNKKVYLHLYVDDGKYYRIFTDSTDAATPNGTEKELGDTSISIQATYDVKDKDGNAQSDRVVTLSEGGTKDICIGIAKKDGAFLYQTADGSDNREAPRELLVSSGHGTTYLVYMVTDTGKHFVEVQ